MIQYLYDGSFEGFLTVIFESFHKKEIPDKIISQKNKPDTLFLQYRQIITDESNAQRVYEGVLNKLSPEIIRKLAYCYCSETENIELDLLNYLQNLFKKGIVYDNNLSDPLILKISKLCRKVSREIHQMKGFVRFSKLKGGIYFSPIEPVFNIVQFLGPHFKKRFPGHDWLICDMKRKIAVFYELTDHNWKIIDPIDLNLIEKSYIIPDHYLDEEEIQYQKLWKDYFHSISIEERQNPKLQRQFMQKKYWKYLIEKQ